VLDAERAGVEDGCIVVVISVNKEEGKKIVKSN
jgi:hypothetical protein